MSVLVFGSVNVDIALYAHRLPRPGETVHGERYAIGLGGKGANQAVAAARLEADTHLVGRIGQDEFGERARTALDRHGVHCEALQRCDTPTGIALIGVDAAAQNCITVVPGANFAVDDSDVRRLERLLPGARCLLLQLELPLATVMAAARAANAAGVPVLLDPAPAPAEALPPALLGAVDVLTPNETETEALLGRRPTTAEEALNAARALQAQGVAAAVVKLGERGVAFAGADAQGFVRPYPVQAVDTTAAGDAFSGGLASAFARGESLADAVGFAAACGALATTRAGAAEAMPERQDVQALINAR